MREDPSSRREAEDYPNERVGTRRTGRTRDVGFETDDGNDVKYIASIVQSGFPRTVY